LTGREQDERGHDPDEEEETAAVALGCSGEGEDGERGPGSSAAKKIGT